MEQVVLRSIGTVSSPVSERMDENWGQITSKIMLKEEYLEVKGLDAIDGTPVLDIKPYYPHYDRIPNPKVPEWVHALMEGYF